MNSNHVSIWMLYELTTKYGW